GLKRLRRWRAGECSRDCPGSFHWRIGERRQQGQREGFPLPQSRVGLATMEDAPRGKDEHQRLFCHQSTCGHRNNNTRLCRAKTRGQGGEVFRREQQGRPLSSQQLAKHAPAENLP
ncbi:hypothetical protein HPB47_020378, partial [Ixodes persulcatus]